MRSKFEGPALGGPPENPSSVVVVVEARFCWVGWLVGWFVGWLVGWLVCWLVDLICCWLRLGGGI